MLLRLNGVVLTSFICLVLLAPLSGQTAPPAGRLLASQCAQCHGTDGQAVGDIDSLHGESAGELYDEMTEMKYSNDPGDIMHRQAKGYTDAQIRLIADYYANSSGGAIDNGNDNDADESDKPRNDDDDDADEDDEPRNKDQRRSRKEKSQKDDD